MRRSRAEQSRAEQSRAEQSRAEQSRAERAAGLTSRGVESQSKAAHVCARTPIATSSRSRRSRRRRRPSRQTISATDEPHAIAMHAAPISTRARYLPCVGMAELTRRGARVNACVWPRRAIGHVDLGGLWLDGRGLSVVWALSFASAEGSLTPSDALRGTHGGRGTAKTVTLTICCVTRRPTLPSRLGTCRGSRGSSCAGHRRRR